MDKTTGERRWNSEISSIDTALVLGGVLSVKQCFGDNKEIVQLATKIYERVDFKWMLDGNPYLLSHGWRPESGFIKSRWDTYSEHALLYSLKHAGQNLAISLQEFIMLSFLYRKKTIKRILFAFLFQTSALPVQSRLVSGNRFANSSDFAACLECLEKKLYNLRRL